MGRVYFCVALIAGIWSVSVGDLNPIPVGDRVKAIQLAEATARELWRINIPTVVRVKEDDGRWRDQASFGEDRIV